jgi:hypothetical protein
VQRLNALKQSTIMDRLEFAFNIIIVLLGILAVGAILLS